MSRTFSDWMSVVMGRRVDLPVPRTVQDLVESRAAIDWSHLNVELPRLAESHLDVELGRPGGRRLLAEIHVPVGEPPFPVLLFLHGGGWYAGSAANERRLAMQLAQAGNVVVSLDYALAPEHPFPAALEDSVYAARWCATCSERFGGDRRRLAIGGASAGANLAAATIVVLHGGDASAVRDRDLGDVPVAVGGCLLLYGVFELSSWATQAGAFAGRAELYQAAYLGASWRSRNRHPLVSPAHAPELDAFPPTYLTCGAQDSVLHQSLGFCAALTAADVPTTLSVVPEADHAFLNVRGADEEIARITRWLAHTMSAHRAP